VSKLQIARIRDGAISLVAGISIYVCEWSYPSDPSFCELNFQCTLVRIYVLPLPIAAILGLLCFRNPLLSWLLFMVPSWLLREIQLVSGGGNLWPLVVFVDFVHLMGTVIIFACAVLLMRRLRMSA